MRQVHARLVARRLVVVEREYRALLEHDGVAGEGPDGANLQTRMAAHISRGAVQFVGRLTPSELARQLRHHDALLLTSDFEGMPNAVLEAMANGCVPVVTNLPSGIPELVQNGVTGMVVNIGAIKDFVQEIERLHTDRELLSRLSEAALDHVRRNFSADAVVPQYETVIRQVWEEIIRGDYKRPYAPRHGPFPGISVPPGMIKELHQHT